MTTTRFDLRAIFAKAHDVARTTRGSYRAIFKAALKAAWQAFKAPVEVPTQKSIAHSLDRAAARADMVGARPASSKQCWYLAGLMLKAGEDGLVELLDTNSVLTSREASSRIDFYLGAR